MKNLTRLSDLRRRFTIALLLAYVGVAIGLAVVVPHQLHSAETQWRSTLSSTAADRAGILDVMIRQRLGELSVLAGTRSAIQLASHERTALAWTGPGPSPTERLVPLLTLAPQTFSLVSVSVVDKDSTLVLSVGATSETVPGLSLYVAAVLKSRTATFVDVLENADGANRVAYVVPMFVDSLMKSPIILTFKLWVVSSIGRASDS